MTKTGKKIIDVLDSLVNSVIVVVALLILFISCYSLLDTLWLYENATDNSLLLYRPSLDVPLEPDKKISGNQVAWLYIDDTTIDYPVMQGEDNYEYLNMDPYGEFSLSGSIFLDYRNDGRFRDPYSVVYGHHMAYGAMFGALDDFRDRDYFDAHTTGRLVTDDAVYDLTLFAVASAKATDETVFDPQGRRTLEIIDFLKENATIYTEPAKDRIVALSTCTSDADLERLILFGTISQR